MADLNKTFPSRRRGSLTDSDSDSDSDFLLDATTPGDSDSDSAPLALAKLLSMNQMTRAGGVL